MKLNKVLAKFGIKPGLERIGKLMDALGHPEKKMKVILVTGTNGKGSVTSYLASILKEAGYKTGSYFSPHLVRYNERFRINGKEISNVKLRKYEKLVLDLFEGKHWQRYEMTEFEALTAMAYKYFADENCDFAVVEIGMGGQYDATNVAEETLSIITNVDIEHTEYLGKTIEQIALEKAGIIKKGISITGATGKALEIVKGRAAEKGIELKVLKENFFVKPIEVNAEHSLFSYLGHSFMNDLEIKLLGRHQIDNVALAISAAEELGIEEETIRKGILNAKNDGRLQIIERKPLVVLDAAHNVHGIKELIVNLSIFDYDKLIVVFGVMKDKNWNEMLILLCPHCDLLVANQIASGRAADANEIVKEASKYTKAIVEKNVKKSFLVAKKHAKKKDMILVCGSIYMLGEFLSGNKN